MIQDPSITDKYMDDYRSGLIGTGVGIGCKETDKHIRFKPNQLVTINGFDNVGKTAWLFWYLLCLSNKHDYSWVVWTGENASANVKIDLVEMLAGKRVSDVSDFEYYRLRDQINDWFKFIDNRSLYEPKALLKVMNDPNNNFKAGVIDPFTGLKRQMDYAGNYDFLNTLVEYTRNSFSIYLTTHPNTDAARKRYPKDHDMWGYFMPPGKSDSEGGQAFANRTDDFWTIHRHVSHPKMKFTLDVHVRKVKNKRTGGEPTDTDDPLRYEWNNGFGYTINGYDPLRNTTKQANVPVLGLNPSNEFDNDIPF